MLTEASSVGSALGLVPVIPTAKDRPADLLARRGASLARAIAKSPEWQSFLQAMRLRDLALVGTAELDPVSRAIAEHFASLAPHQRPAKADATEALQRIEIAARMLRWLAADPFQLSIVSLSSPDRLTGGAPAAFPHRCLAPLYFPKQSGTWRTIVAGILTVSMQEVAVRMLDRQCGGDLIEFVACAVDRQKDVPETLRRHFDADLFTICWHLTCGPEWLDDVSSSAGFADRTAEEQAESAARWDVLWQWVGGKSFITVPSELRSEAINWQDLERRHSRVCELLRQSRADRSVHAGGHTQNRRCVEAEACEQVGIIAKGEAIRVEPGTGEIAEGTTNNKRIIAPRSGSIAIESDTAAEVRSPRCEVRMSDDPAMLQSVRAVLERYRTRGESLALVRLCAIGPDGSASRSDGRRLSAWHEAVMTQLASGTCGEISLAFLTTHGDLSLLVGGFDRTELVRRLRNDLLNAGVSAATAPQASTQYSLVAGAATIANPQRRTEIDQLLSAAERCLQGALLQGRGSIKSLDVF